MLSDKMSKICFKKPSNKRFQRDVRFQNYKKNNLPCGTEEIWKIEIN